MFKKCLMFGAAAALALAVVAPKGAEAVQVRITNLDTFETVFFDAGVGGVVDEANIVLGATTVEAIEASSDDFGNNSLLTQVSTRITGNNRIQVEVTEIDFSEGAAAPSFSNLRFVSNGSLPQNAASLESSAGFVDDGNGAFATTDIVDAAFAGNGDVTDFAVLGAPFSMTMVIIVDGSLGQPSSKGRQTTVDSTLTATVPVPAALPLFASALVGLGLLSRRRRSA